MSEHVLVNSGLNLLIRLSPFFNLPREKTRITKDPHSFDQNNETGRLLIHVLRYLRDSYSKEGQESLATHETQETQETKNSQDIQDSQIPQIPQIPQASQSSQDPQSILTGAEELGELYCGTSA